MNGKDNQVNGTISREPLPAPEAADDPFSVIDGDELLTMPSRRRALHWSVSWSDLMMTMFILFVVMYIYKVGNRDLDLGKGPGKGRIVESGAGLLVESRKGPAKIPEFKEDSEAIVYELTRSVEDKELLRQVTSVDLVEDETVRIIITGDLLFAQGSADLLPAAADALGRLGSVLGRTNHYINVAGHTDSVPYHSEAFPTNWELSTMRAVRVARYLIEELKIPDYRFVITAHAYHKPLKPNTTSRNRAENRRVEIVLMKNRP